MKYVILATILFTSLSAFADCQILHSNGSQAFGHEDVLFKNLSTQHNCPQNVFALKELLISDGLQISPSMVANRGRNNPRFGSFSLFEFGGGFSNALGKTISPDELFFGHFTRAQGGSVHLDQSPSPGKLLIELIAWDHKKQIYNFYELIGTQTGGLWFYRGDSKDAFMDNQKLHRQEDPNSPQFGRHMRCSACHTSGGPIMKELKAPHNDWWTAQRALPFAPNQLSKELETWLHPLSEASEFATVVLSGIEKLETSAAFQVFKKSLTLQEQLRPLFCTTEINLISDQTPLETANQTISVPSSYWVNPILQKVDPIEIQKQDYISILLDKGFQFPETQNLDADHGWLAPVKGESDLLAIQTLIDQGIVDEEFIADVLAVDLKHPLFSQQRCSLLKQLPSSPTVGWKEEFVKALQSSTSESAKELHSNFVDAKRNQSFHKAQALKYLENIQEALQEPQNLEQEILDLQKKRLSVFENEISKNPLGQILEPGFRVIFPSIVQ